MKTPKFINQIRFFFDSVHIPFLGISLFKMFEIYGKGIFKNNLGKQAAGISWEFFMSLFPFILFMLSLLPFFPHYDNLLYYFLNVILPNILPDNIEGEVKNYLQNFLIPNIKSINGWSIVFALFLGTNGTQSLINGFNINTELKRNFIREYLIALAVTMVFIFFVIVTVLGVYYSEVVLKLYNTYDLPWILRNLTKIIGYFSFPLTYFLLLSVFYWIGCLKITAWKQAVPGAILTTVLFVIFTYLFAIYLKNFAKYNLLYGSIGTIIIGMIWLNVNIIFILLGNELNLAIYKVRMDKMIQEELKKDLEALD